MSTKGMNGCKVRGYGICSFCWLFQDSSAAGVPHITKSILRTAHFFLLQFLKMWPRKSPNIMRDLPCLLLQPLLESSYVTHIYWSHSWTMLANWSSLGIFTWCTRHPWPETDEISVDGSPTHCTHLSHRFIIQHITYASCARLRKLRHKPNLQLPITHYAALSNPTLYKTELQESKVSCRFAQLATIYTQLSHNHQTQIRELGRSETLTKERKSIRRRIIGIDHSKNQKSNWDNAIKIIASSTANLCFPLSWKSQNAARDFKMWVPQFTDPSAPA